MLKALVLTLIACVATQPQATVPTQQTLETVYDSQKNLSTVRLPVTKLSGEKDRYHSLSFAIDYSYPGQTPTPPERVNFELTSVVKARRLNSDLYVVFLVDENPMHFGSNRSAIRNPVPGKPWIGEKMVFLIPREDFFKLAAAKKLAIKMGGVTFEFSNELRDKVRAVMRAIKYRQWLESPR